MVEGNDARDLAAFGYRQELDRTLGAFSAFAAGFSYISILTGLFQTFAFGFAAGHQAILWSWPLVLAGQFLVALNFAELAAHFPLSGGVYQWSKLVGSPFLGWTVGWTYTACLIVTLAAVALALQNTLPLIWPGFQITGSAASPHDGAVNAVILGCLLLAVSTWLNMAGVKVLALVNNLGVFAELAGVIVLIAALAFSSVRPAAAVFSPPSVGPLLVSGAVTASYVLYGFDTAASLAEETHDPRRRAPRAILRALSAAGVLGMLVLLLSLTSARNLAAGELGRADGGLPWLVKDVLGGRFGTVLLCDVAVAILACTLAVHAGAVRLIFAVARDGGLPFSEALSRVSGSSRTPTVPVLVTGIGAVAILVLNVNLPKLIELVTMVAALWANLAYFLVLAALLWRRIRREQLSDHASAFTLGRAAPVINLLGLLWSAFMVLNLGWPRAAIYGDGLLNRFAPLMLTAALLIFGGASYAWMRATAPRGGNAHAA
jgi:urea carboxylase system permease